eukprot:9004047-Heterocapsa_arctica.AAC.1
MRCGGEIVIVYSLVASCLGGPSDRGRGWGKGMRNKTIAQIRNSSPLFGLPDMPHLATLWPGDMAKGGNCGQRDVGMREVESRCDLTPEGMSNQVAQVTIPESPPGGPMAWRSAGFPGNSS